MARRSPTNPRYGKDAPQGKTRRSASAAKLKRAAVEPEGKKASAPKGARAARGRAARPTPQRLEMTPEMRHWQNINWVLFGVVIVSAIAAFLLLEADERQLGTVAIGFETAALAASLWVTFGPLRRARQEAVKKQAKGGKRQTDAESAEPARESGPFWRRNKKPNDGKGE